MDTLQDCLTAEPSLSRLPSDLQETARYIASVQQKSGAIPWFKNGKCDPWDHIEAAMGLSIAGYHKNAEAAYAWLRQQQLPDGSWHTHYFITGDDEFADLHQTHFVSYIATGIWHHYLVTGNIEFLTDYFPVLEKAINRVIKFQTEEGDMAWSYDRQGIAGQDALVTGCSSILRSLDCALRAARQLKKSCPSWQVAAQRLMEAIRNKPHRFDRSWPSKQRFAMDWYYPILSGAFSQPEAKQHILKRWHEFVEPKLGCRCVNDEPWVTMAETSELVIALVAAGENDKARGLFHTVHQWRHDHDGGYWTGYVFRDNAIWPQEKTTWTAGAVLLAADALYHYSPANALFTQPILLGKRPQP